MTALVKVENFTPDKPQLSPEELSIMEQVIIKGDLSQLSPGERITYYHATCKSLGLNPFTKPFEYIELNKKLTLYAKKDATEQLRKLNGISIEKIETKLIDDIYVVTATARTKDGRTDSATGAVTIGHLRGDAKANALMKAETKAKRRVTLSISGMGWCDESEIETIPAAKPLEVDLETGELKQTPITSVQAKELNEIYSECSEDSKKGFMEYIKNTCQANSISSVPAKEFERFKRMLSIRRDEHQKFLAEKEMTINITTEE